MKLLRKQRDMAELWRELLPQSTVEDKIPHTLVRRDLNTSSFHDRVWMKRGKLYSKLETQHYFKEDEYLEDDEEPELSKRTNIPLDVRMQIRADAAAELAKNRKKGAKTPKPKDYTHTFEPSPELERDSDGEPIFPVWNDVGQPKIGLAKGEQIIYVIENSGSMRKQRVSRLKQRENELRNLKKLIDFDSSL